MSRSGLARRRLGYALEAALLAAVAVALAHGCLAEGRALPAQQTDDDAGPTIIEAGVVDAAEVRTDAPAPDPHSVLGVDPAHGPFTGGQRAVVRGTGFGGDVRIWFGPNQAAASDTVAVSPTQAQVTVPPGAAGPADVTAQNGEDESTRRTLAANRVSNAEVMVSDCGAAVLPASPGQGLDRRNDTRRFDGVITNPPFHQGVGVDYEVARQFVRDAARVLRRGGRLFLVANRFLCYGDLIRETFGNVTTAYADNRYHVLSAVARNPT